MSDKHDVQPGAPGEQTESAAPAQPSTADKPPMSEETASLMGLIDRLTALLERSDLDELEVEAGRTGIILRKPSALLSGAGAVAMPGSQAADAAGSSEPVAKPAEVVAPVPTTRAVKAPLTGIFYGAS